VDADIQLLFSLAEDADRRIREQAIVLLQNVATTSQNIAFVIEGLGSERLGKILQKAMSNNDPKAVEHVRHRFFIIITFTNSTCHRQSELSAIFPQAMNLIGISSSKNRF
jgi:hypothetical protein